MLFKYFVKETPPKYGGFADFSTTSLPTMRAYLMHIIVNCLKLEEKQLCDGSLA